MSINGASRIIIDDSRAMLQIVASLTDSSRGVSHNRNIFIVHSTDVSPLDLIHWCNLHIDVKWPLFIILVFIHKREDKSLIAMGAPPVEITTFLLESNESEIVEAQAKLTEKLKISLDKSTSHCESYQSKDISFSHCIQGPMLWNFYSCILLMFVISLRVYPRTGLSNLCTVFE